MAICPKCKEKIENLSYNSKVSVTQIFSIEEKIASYSSMGDYGDHSEEEYKCPECYETIATNEKDAFKFLAR